MKNWERRSGVNKTQEEREREMKPERFSRRLLL